MYLRTLYTIVVIILLVLQSLQSDKSSLYNEISSVIKSKTSAGVYLKGSFIYNKRRQVRNGACNNIYPDLVAVPKSTKDVSKLVSIARLYNVSISIRSGGHSYVCQSTKPEGIHIDMRRMNKVELTNSHPYTPTGPALILGPGSTWNRVLHHFPVDQYTMVHGVCLDVGVGGYLLGGGVHYAGTSMRYLSGSSNVLQYTLVDAEGDIYKVSSGNITCIDKETGIGKYQLPDDYSLFLSLQLAGSSFGIATEFQYRVYNVPEVQPVIALVYIENKSDLWRFEAAALDGRYHMSLFTALYFTTIDWFLKERLGETTARIISKVLPILQNRAVNPVFLVINDNFPNPYQKRTDKEKVYNFLRRYGLKLALSGKITDLLQPSVSWTNAESLFQTDSEQARLGPRPIVSANFGNLTTLRSIDDLLLHHPLFGLKNLNSRQSYKFQCEFCGNVITVAKHPKGSVLSPNKDPVILIFSGNYAFEFSCWYKPRTNSRCPRIVRNAKTMFRNMAIRNSEKLTQYSNTATCDSTNDFHQRYWSPSNLDILLKAKQFWDPHNTFNHCHSVGSKDEHCCPKDL